MKERETHQSEHKQEHPRGERVREVEHEDVKERGVVRSALEGREIPPPTGPKRELMPLRVTLCVSRDVGRKRSLLRVIVPRDGTVEVGIVLVIVMPFRKLVTALRVEVGVAFGMERGEDGVSEGRGERCRRTQGACEGESASAAYGTRVQRRTRVGGIGTQQGRVFGRVRIVCGI